MNYVPSPYLCYAQLISPFYDFFDVQMYNVRRVLMNRIVSVDIFPRHLNSLLVIYFQ